ncbi:TPA: hypothetical protein VGS73_003734 [Vibrio cholerae]|uniref:hypothetical protein n=1 Tax=Vibrio cholerae TaxID=666 RepID=UPI0018F0C909|nr:hypothetical protein [Vibrio cholerae]MBJ6888894.1 hypothetical protein [Vibrio cholerae]UIP02173.1 hypothetical protein LY388_04905 [Vibrio cholerae]HEQ3434960.1 hypothetical protein [Vibrio cholerae]HEQ3495859.1 hypothetical protein [Vibrio cholerae]HEQ3507618.1 hypothetical protein [Vibrio cholerae]
MEITNKEQFLDTFLERYLERGFGTLSKSEIDMLMMHLLLENSDLRYKPNHEISVALKITETKVKNLKHRASLQFVSDSDNHVKAEFLALLHKAQLTGENGKVVVVIEDAFVKQGVQAKLKALGHFADNSFNSELVKISYPSFIALLEDFYSQEDVEFFENEINTALEKDEESRISFKEICQNFINGMATKAGEKTFELGAFVATGGMSEVSTFADAVKAVLAGDEDSN